MKKILKNRKIYWTALLCMLLLLGRFPAELEKDLKTALENSTKAVRLIVSDEIDKAMNLYNS